MSDCLDLEVLDELVEIMGDEMNMLIHTYINDTETKLAEFVKMDLSGNQEDIYRMAHSLKGSSGNLGIKLFYECCVLIEGKSREGELSERDFNPTHIYELFNNAKSELLTKFT